MAAEKGEDAPGAAGPEAWAAAAGFRAPAEEAGSAAAAAEGEVAAAVAAAAALEAPGARQEAGPALVATQPPPQAKPLPPRYSAPHY